MVTEIRFHGRGGQGAVTAAAIFAEAAMQEDMHVQKMARYGGERRGAPVASYVRIDDEPIRDMHLIYEPDCIVVLDPVLPSEIITAGLKQGGIAILNNLKKPEEIDFKVELSKIATVDATGIALDLFGPRAIPITNTTMLGAMVGTTKWIKLESLFEPISNAFRGEIGEKNIEAVKRGFNMVDVKVNGSEMI